MLAANQFDFIRSEFSQYYIKNCGSDCDSRGDWSGNETWHSDSGFISKTDARRLLGIDNGTMNELIKTGTLTAKVQSKGKKRLIFIDLTDLTNLKSESGK
jgi:hypothetical protein